MRVGGEAQKFPRVSTLSKVQPILYTLCRCTAHTFGAILKDKQLAKPLLKAIREICYNLLYTELPLTARQRTALRKRKNLLLALVETDGKSLTKATNLIRRNWNFVAKHILTLLETSLAEICSNID